MRIDAKIDTKAKAAQVALAATVLGLGLVLGLATSHAHAGHAPGAAVHGGVAVSVAGPSHHRSGPPVHRGPPLHHSSPPMHRRARAAHVSPQARMADWYARTAVSQSHTAWRFGCANSHPRWSTSYHDHYQWAYGRSAHQVEREVERREHTLARCLAW